MPTIIHIIKWQVRIIRIVDDHGPAKAVAILGRQMAVVPERARLVETGELILERVAGGDRTLVHHGSAILPVGTGLIDSVEMLDGRPVNYLKQLMDAR